MRLWSKKKSLTRKMPALVPAASKRTRQPPKALYVPTGRVKDDYDDSSFSESDLASDNLSDVSQSSSSQDGSTCLSGFLVVSEGTPQGTNSTYNPSTWEGSSDSSEVDLEEEEGEEVTSKETKDEEE